MALYDNSRVRRQDRLLSADDAFELIGTAEYGVLSLIEKQGEELTPYGIPLNYAWDGENVLYFHTAPAGQKLVCIQQNKAASFCLTGKTQVLSDKFTTNYESVILRGKIETDLPSAEKRKALELLLDKYSPEDKAVGLKYAEKSFHRTEILRFTIQTISGKAKQIKS